MESGTTLSNVGGEHQANKYINQMESRFEWLTTNSHLGAKRNEVKEGYLSYFEGKHTIFYRKAGEDIEIIGIPHQNEDVIKHLDIEEPTT